MALRDSYSAADGAGPRARQLVSQVLDTSSGHTHDGVDAALVAQHTKGRIYYVDTSNGDDDNDGLLPTEAFKTSQTAIDACTDNYGDRIIRLPGTESVSEAVDFNKKGIIYQAVDTGYNRFGQGERFCIYGTHTDGPAAVISAPCRIEGIGFCGSETAGASLEIDGSTGAFGGGNFWEIINCRFSHWGIAKAYALLIEAGSDGIVQGCMFDGYLTGYTTAAIGLDDSGSNGVLAVRILDNEFINIGSGKYCIQMVDSAVHFRMSRIMRNVNLGTAKFINFNSADDDGWTLIADNYTGGTTDTGSYNASVDTLQSAGWQISNNHYDE